jgi:hypothetical protein
MQPTHQPPMIDDAVEAFDVLLNADVHAIKDEGLLSYVDVFARERETTAYPG